MLSQTRTFRCPNCNEMINDYKLAERAKNIAQVLWLVAIPGIYHQAVARSDHCTVALASNKDGRTLRLART